MAIPPSTSERPFALSGQATAEGASDGQTIERCFETRMRACVRGFPGHTAAAVPLEEERSAGPDSISQDPWHACTYRILQRGLGPTEGSPCPCHFTDGPPRPQDRNLPGLYSPAGGGPRKQARLCRRSSSPLAPTPAPPGVSFPHSSLGGKVHVTKKGRARRHGTLTVEPQAPAAGELGSCFGRRGTFWHTSCPTLRGQLGRVGPSLSPPP